MSLEAFGDGDDGLDGYVTDARAEEAFVAGYEHPSELESKMGHRPRQAREYRRRLLVRSPHA